VQLHARLEAVGARLESDIQQAMLRPAAERVDPYSLILREVSKLEAVFEGPIAAVLQGVAMPVDAADVAIAPSTAAGLTAWLRRRGAKRWSERWREFSDWTLDLAEPGPLHWRTVHGDIRARIWAEPPPSVDVLHEGVTCRVRPLAELEMTDPMLEALLRRYREGLSAP
jgi:hypothetical protein